MGLRKILGLPQKAKTAAPATAAPVEDRAVWDKARTSCGLPIADPRFKALPAPQKAALDVAWTNAAGLAAANAFNAARRELETAPVVAANNAVAADKARQT